MKKNFSISQNGIDLIKESEGFSDVPYKCSAGKRTIGWGHKIKEGEVFTKITKEQAETLLRTDTRWVEKTINNTISADLTQNEIDALASLIYNIGGTAFRKSTVLRKLNEDNYMDAADAFLMWDKVTNPETGEHEFSQGLANRREKERELFMTDNANV